jgi:hypothetical protein
MRFFGGRFSSYSETVELRGVVLLLAGREDERAYMVRRQETCRGSELAGAGSCEGHEVTGLGGRKVVSRGYASLGGSRDGLRR